MSRASQVPSLFSIHMEIVRRLYQRGDGDRISYSQLGRGEKIIFIESIMRGRSKFSFSEWKIAKGQEYRRVQLKCD